MVALALGRVLCSITVHIPDHSTASTVCIHTCGSSAYCCELLELLVAKVAADAQSNSSLFYLFPLSEVAVGRWIQALGTLGGPSPAGRVILQADPLPHHVTM
ncbi:hypothetical protein EYF80_014549 [Liparis tanakae]|uniref:Uncharacterized protein n=1 Tax=Liparis tanakae TaxID=230148 RepID=A0A4Z2IAP4_9TELE|nr:hypothetical protein EYF80_014549 [Liparis tanakae]